MSEGRPRAFRGIAASPGVAIGRVFLLNRHSVRAPHVHVRPDETEPECARLAAAIELSVQQLAAVRAGLAGGAADHLAILEAHELILRDRSLFAEASQLIRSERINAEWAVERVVARLRALLDRIGDPYFQERRGDVDFAADRILRNLVGSSTDIGELPLGSGPVVLVAHDLSPVDTAILAQRKIAAFVTEVGGKTSHTAIIARAMELPAVVGVRGIVDAVGSGDTIFVDGVDAAVTLRPSQAQLERGRRRIESFERMRLELLEARLLPARTTDGYELCVAGNIELPTEVAPVLARGGEGIGLYRTEFMFLGRTTAPTEEDHFNTYRKVVDAADGREVTIRTFDLGGDKVFPGARHDPEANPALGMRAIRYSLAHPELFEPQLAAILRIAAHGNVRLMLPMISGVEELDASLELIERVSARLRRDGSIHRAELPIGVMIEVPSSVLLAEHLAQRCDFFSIGTNDLVQYLLAADRGNERVDYLYHPAHPAVLRALAAVTSAAAAANIPVSVCGEMAGELEHTALLVGLGFSQLSMNAAAITAIKRVVAELSKVECEDLAKEALACATRADVMALVREFMRTKTLFPTALARAMRGSDE